MSSLLNDWPFKCVDTTPAMAFQNDDRIKHYLGSTGVVRGYDLFNPHYFYVQFDDMDIPSRIPVTSLEKVDD